MASTHPCWASVWKVLRISTDRHLVHLVSENQGQIWDITPSAIYIYTFISYYIYIYIIYIYRYIIVLWLCITMTSMPQNRCHQTTHAFFQDTLLAPRHFPGRRWEAGRGILEREPQPQSGYEKWEIMGEKPGNIMKETWNICGILWNYMEVEVGG